MDSSIENARLADELTEVGDDESLLAMTYSRTQSDAILKRHLLKEWRCKQQAKHKIKNSMGR